MLAYVLSSAAAAISIALLTVPAMAQDTVLSQSNPVSEKSVQPDDPIVATVNGEPILKSEVMEAVNALPPQYSQMPPEMLVAQMAQQIAALRLVAAKGYEVGLKDDPEVRARLEEEERRIVQNVWLLRETDSRITDQMVRDAYDQYLVDNPPQEEVKARHILVESDDKARDIIGRLEQGEDFADLASAYTTDPSGETSGGDLGWFSREQMVPEFGDAAFKLTPGNYTTEPVETQFGWHVIMVDDKRTLSQPGLEELKPQLHDQLVKMLVPQIIKEVADGADIQVISLERNSLPSGSETPHASNDENVTDDEEARQR